MNQKHYWLTNILRERLGESDAEVRYDAKTKQFVTEPDGFRFDRDTDVYDWIMTITSTHTNQIHEVDVVDSPS